MDDLLPRSRQPRKGAAQQYQQQQRGDQNEKRPLDELRPDDCLVVNNTVQKNDFTQSVFWYKAKLRTESFRIGSRAFHRYSRRYRDRSRDSDQEQHSDDAAVDMRSLMRQFRPERKHGRVNIKKAVARHRSSRA